MKLSKDNIFNLLQKCVELLLQIPSEELINQRGINFEFVVQKNLELAIKLSGYINVDRVELVSGSRYPDIVIHTHQNKIGVEVKTSQRKEWTTLGGSIFESTRVKNVENVVLFFANYHDPDNVKFRFDWMDNCISDVLITHKPRYAINMDVDKTFFDLSGVSYKDIQQSDRPFSLIRNYLKERAGSDADVWWIDESSEDINNIGPQSIRMLSSLLKEEREKINTELCILFPEILSVSPKKYNRVSSFLITKKGLFHPSIRDFFSASGKHDFKGKAIPKYFEKILDEEKLNNIVVYIENIPWYYLEEYWGDFKPDISRIFQWKRKVFKYISNNSAISYDVCNEIIDHINKNTM